ncbi:MAG TPA: hypothetical protein VL022_07665 [Moheibacter sp.]|nr:hypothetical protein [Moheibacter sp.]
MKTKSLLLLLFVTFWTIIYGVSFFGSNTLKAAFRGFIPTGYKMYAPPTKTNYDVVFTYCSKGEIIDQVHLSTYINEAQQQSMLHQKAAFVKERLFLYSMRTWDVDVQKALYQAMYLNGENDFEKEWNDSERLVAIRQSLLNFSQIYWTEKAEVEKEWDQLKIEATRHPIVIKYAPDYQKDFTYTVGEKVFYQEMINF